VVTTPWKSVHRISGYQPDIRGIMNGPEKIDQFPIKYLIDLRRKLKIICWLYLHTSQTSVDSGQRVKNLKNRWKQPFFDRIQQEDIYINRISRPFAHRISWVVTPLWQLSKWACGSHTHTIRSVLNAYVDYRLAWIQVFFHILDPYRSDLYEKTETEEIAHIPHI